MKIGGQGISQLQQLLENEETEASNLPKQNTGAAATKRAHPAHHRGTHHNAEEMLTSPDLVIKPLSQFARSLANKQRSRKRGSVDHPEAATSSSEIEELLMMLEERNNGEAHPVIRASSRKKDGQNGQQSGSSEPDHLQMAMDFRAGGRKGVEAQHDVKAASQARSMQMKPSSVDGRSNYIWLEAALNDIRSAAADLKSSNSLVPHILKIIRDYLDLPADIANAPGTLKTVRKRVLALPKPEVGHEAKPLLTHNMHLFLPILLLNASRPRTDAQRGIGKAAIDSILRRYSP